MRHPPVFGALVHQHGHVHLVDMRNWRRFVHELQRRPRHRQLDRVACFFASAEHFDEAPVRDVSELHGRLTR